MEQAVGSGVGLVIGLIIVVVFGGVVGWIASLVVKGSGLGLIGDVVLGIAGAFLAGFVLPRIGMGLPGGIVFEGNGSTQGPHGGYLHGFGRFVQRLHQCRDGKTESRRAGCPGGCPGLLDGAGTFFPGRSFAGTLTPISSRPGPVPIPSGNIKPGSPPLP